MRPQIEAAGGRCRGRVSSHVCGEEDYLEVFVVGWCESLGGIQRHWRLNQSPSPGSASRSAVTSRPRRPSRSGRQQGQPGGLHCPPSPPFCSRLAMAETRAGRQHLVQLLWLCWCPGPAQDGSKAASSCSRLEVEQKRL